jgi:pimeloyl-ACP methyl ester carboxylesterase
MPIARARGFDVDYEDVGSGPAVILLHSSASGNRQWRRLSDELKDRYRLIAINLFGYGATTPWTGAEELTLGDAADLVAAVADRVDQPIALVGHSLGAAVALEAARTLRGRIRMLIAFEPILFYLLKEHGPFAAYAEIANVATVYCGRAEAGDWAAVGELFIDYWSGPGTWAGLGDERRSGLTRFLPNVVHEWSAVINPWRALAEWSAIAAPTHLIRAADSRVPTRAIAALLAAANPSWRLHDVASGGHMAPVARPDVVNPLIARLLDEALM